MPVQIVQQYFATIMNISNIGPVCSGWHVRRAVSLLHSVQHRPIGLGTPVRLKGSRAPTNDRGQSAPLEAEVQPNNSAAKDNSSRSGVLDFGINHRDIIKVLYKRRHQLKARIQFLREREREQRNVESKLPSRFKEHAMAKSERLAKETARLSPSSLEISSTSTGLAAIRGPQSGVRDSVDRRLESLSGLHVADLEHLEQDHLSNISDFRLQTKKIVQPEKPLVRVPFYSSRSDKRPKNGVNVPPIVRRKPTTEAQIDERIETDIRLRELNLSALNRSLRAYILACTHTEMTNQAMNAVLFYRDKYQSHVDRARVLDVHVCNLLLNMAAKKGRMDRVKEIFHWMKDDRIQPNTKSFALALECAGRQANFESKTARRIAAQMQQEKIEFNDIFSQCSFVSDEKERIMSVLHKLQPNFQPSYPETAYPYEGEILQPLNERCSPGLRDTPYRGTIEFDTAAQFLEQQLRREMDGKLIVKSVDVPEKVTDKTTLKHREKLEEMKIMWRNILAESFERNKELLKNQVNRQRGVNIYPFLCTLPSEEFVDMLVQEVISLSQMSEGYSPTTILLDMQLGSKVMNKYLVRAKVKYGLVDRLRGVYHEYLKYFNDMAAVSAYNCREQWQRTERDMQLPISPILTDHVWPSSVTMRVGKFLYNIIINEVKVDINCMRTVPTTPQYAPAVFKVYRHYAEVLKEELKPHPKLVRLYKASLPETLEFESIMCPTIVPPLPWTHTRNGGYLLQNTIFTRIPDSANLGTLLVDKVPSKQLNAVFDSLNQLGASPWIVNKPMLDFIIGIFRNKGMPDVDIPPPPSECPPFPKISGLMSREEKAETYKEMFRLKRRRNEMFSLWCDALYKLSIANHFRDCTFYFPHNIDFRGRVYPVPPHFQHLGGDMVRSILLFAKGMPLGVNGLDWLKIHLVNLTGLKKKNSIADRLAYANEVMEEIVDSANSPLTGRQWWKKSDDPWQTLACCKEIVEASRSTDSKSFISHFPIHQDGSCNGLQHYAALGRDQKGAEKVNLAPHDVPQDVYSAVAALVEEQRKKDAEEGLLVAMVLDGFVGRKVVKQTVMTIVYGVTRYGARSQIHGQLTDIKEFPQDKVWPAASYLAAKTFDSIKQMFSATRQIQDWFVDCARLISTVREKPVEWVTPLGLPVVQPYFKQDKNRISRSKIHLAVDIGKINTMKQKNAFPPNFIHSLDSTHMMLTCLHSARAGISFVSVHDSFWTHPITVDTMNRICREQFVTLHSRPILEDLSRDFVKRFAFKNSDLTPLPLDSPPVILTNTLSAVPEKGTFDLKSVLRSTYFFS